MTGGWLDACWHQGAERIGSGIDLGNRQVYVDVGLEEYLLDRDALKRLALHVADVANVGAVRGSCDLVDTGLSGLAFCLPLDPSTDAQSPCRAIASSI
jgi:hypothetical protein